MLIFTIALCDMPTNVVYSMFIAVYCLREDNKTQMSVSVLVAKIIRAARQSLRNQQKPKIVFIGQIDIIVRLDSVLWKQDKHIELSVFFFSYK